MKSRRLSLFLTFLKIGAFTFGGGYAMIALLEHELIEKKGWIGHDEFLDMAAIAESTPGPVAVNAATYVGFHVAGVSGAALATLAVCLPSFLIIFAISQFFDRFLALTTVGYAFRGIQVCVVYLIASAGWKMVRKLPHRPLQAAYPAQPRRGVHLKAFRRQNPHSPCSGKTVFRRQRQMCRLFRPLRQL